MALRALMTSIAHGDVASRHGLLALAAATALAGCGSGIAPLRTESRMVDRMEGATHASYALLSRTRRPGDLLPTRTAGGAANPGGLSFSTARLAKIRQPGWRIWGAWSKGDELCVIAFTPVDPPIADAPGAICGPPGSATVGVVMTVGGTRAGGAGLAPHATELAGLVPDGPSFTEVLLRGGREVRVPVVENVFHAALSREVVRVSYVRQGRRVVIPTPVSD
jgi:hypothetical protein